MYKELSKSECATNLQGNGKRYPVFHFDDKGVSTNFIKFEIVAGVLKFPARVQVKNPDMCREGEKGDYLCFNPTQGGFYFILPAEYFRNIWEPKKGAGLIDMIKDKLKLN